MDEKQVHKKGVIKFIIATVVLILVVLGITLSMNLFNSKETMQTVEKEQTVKNQKSEGTQQVEVTNQDDEPETFRKFDERTVEITKYELFYRDSSFYPREAVEFFSITETIRKFALFHHLEQHNYKWDDETRGKFRERVKSELEYDKQNPELFTYFETMFDELQITEEEYIEHYLLVNKEYDILYREQFDKSIGLNDGAYPSGDAENKYRNLMGISEDYLNELAEKIPESLDPIEPQPYIPFIYDDSYLTVTTNDDGEYIFTASRHFMTDMAQEQIFLLFELENRVVKEEISRHSLQKFKEAVESYESHDDEKIVIASELAQIFEILERTIEMELY